MSKPLTEQIVLRKLKIDSFRQLTKDKVINMASMLDKMDPEVGKKALEQFPEFASTMKEILTEYRESLNKALESNEESVKSFYASADQIISSLTEELKKENLSFDEKKYIIDKMVDVLKLKGDKDSENKRFINAIAGFGLLALGIIAVGIQSTLGGNTSLNNNDSNE